MKSKFSFLVCLSFCTFGCVGQQRDFQSYYTDTFTSLQEGASLATDLGLASLDSITCFNVNSSSLRIIASKSALPPTRFIPHKYFPVGYFKMKDKVVLLYNTTDKNEYGENILATWAKSFSHRGDRIDSVQVAKFADYEEVSLRKFYSFSKGIITVTNCEKISKEVGDEVLQESRNITFQVDLTDDGRFVVNNKPPFYFQSDVRFATLVQTLKEFHRDCFKVQRTAIGVVSQDLGECLVVLLTRNLNKCGGKFMDLIVCPSNDHGFFNFNGTQGGVDLNPQQFSIGKVWIEDGNIMIEVTCCAGRKAIAAFKYSAKNRLCYLESVELFDQNKTMTSFGPNLHLPFNKSASYLTKLLQQ
jgi:hypothetical protein